MPYLVLLIIRVVFGFWAMSVATGKGRSAGWFWLAFVSPLIGIIVAYCLSEQAYAPEPRPYYGVTVQCPYYQNGRPTYLSTANALTASPTLPAPRTAEDDADDGKWVICATCGERATLYYARIRKLCPQCDTPYDLESKPKEPEAAAGGATTGSAVQSAPDARPRICGTCGKGSPSGAEYCMFCGASLMKDWTCPGCNSANPPAAKFCMHCGSKREE